MRRAAPTLAAAATLVLAGCGAAHDGIVSDGTSATATADSSVTVTATDDACRVSSTTTAPGNVAFVVTNDGSAPTTFDVLVYDAGQQTVGTAAGIPVGATRTLVVRDMVPAYYITVCRPSATGRDINANFYVDRAAS